MLRYLDFINELKKYKLNLFKSEKISHMFTYSIEIEMETTDKTQHEEEYTDDYLNKILNNIKKSVIKELLRIDDFHYTQNIEEFIDYILEEVKQENDDYDFLFDDLLNSENFKEDNYNRLIVELIRPQVLTYFFSDNFEYLESKFIENLPSFYRNYKTHLKFELDNTLDRGIEISNLDYFNNIDDLIKMIESFYNDFEKQNYWIFNDNTGIHINIGLKENSNFNYIKGLLFLNDTVEEPFVFRNMEWRKNSKFCGSILKELSNNSNLLEECYSKIFNIEEVEKLLNSELESIIKKIGYKNFGVNFTPVKRFNYVEFRYPGGNINKEILIDKLLYFTYIIYLMTNTEFNKKEYYKKLYKFLKK